MGSNIVESVRHPIEIWIRSDQGLTHHLRPTLAHGLAVPHKDGRLIFLLPWKGQLLIGTTERHQATADSIEASKARNRGTPQRSKITW